MLNAAAQSIEDLRALRVNREEEVESAYSALAENWHNVLLYGTRGVGKTFLTRIIEDEVAKRTPEALPCFINLASLAVYDDAGDEVAAFPRAVLLQLCSSIWTTIIQKPYLALRGHISDSGHEINTTPSDESTVRDIYTYLMRQDITDRSNRQNTAGFNFGARGELRESFTHEHRQQAVLPFEFGEFVSQLTSDVLMPRGKRKIIIFCDEANHASIYKQEQILERYFELFSSRRVQFLFVAAQGPWQEKEYVPTCFETKIELGGFKDRTDTVQMVQSTCVDSSFTFTEEAFDVLIDTFEGHPRNSLEASERAIQLARARGQSTVSVRDMLRACRDVEKSRAQELIARDGVSGNS
jgi:hypothetical protein